MSKKFKIVRVTMDVDYLIPMVDDTHTTINGWSLKYLIRDWFKGRHDINSYHMTRDTYRVGNGTKIIRTKVLKDTEFPEAVK